MNVVKEQLLSILTMQDVLSKYGIKTERNGMFHCCLHGEDKNASAKCYKDSFYCFTCNKHGDFIQFVQYLYNLNFQEAMNKIIDDFSLPIKTTGYYDKNKIIEMQKQRELEQKKKDEERLYFIRLCKRKDSYNHIIEILEKQITEENWEDLTYTISYFTNKVELLNLYICDRYNIQN